MPEILHFPDKKPNLMLSFDLKAMYWLRIFTHPITWNEHGYFNLNSGEKLCEQFDVEWAKLRLNRMSVCDMFGIWVIRKMIFMARVFVWGALWKHTET